VEDEVLAQFEKSLKSYEYINDSVEISPMANMNLMGAQPNQQQSLQPEDLQNGLQHESSKVVDGLLADELLKLSFIDRNAINEEIHGVRSLAVDETPSMISTALHVFQIELELLPPEQKQSYLLIQTYRHREQLQQQRPNPFGMLPENNSVSAATYAAYVDDNDFRLRFLRCCLFDVSKAVRRFANYLNFIHKYWGESCLAKPIRLSDLNDTEIKILKQGFFQILPFRDRSGRRIFANMSNANGLEDVASTKVVFYIVDCATRDSVESQRNGIISVSDGTRYRRDWANPKSETNLRLLNLLRLKRTDSESIVVEAHSAFPSRLASVHFIWPDQNVLWATMKLYLLSTSIAVRHGVPSGSVSALEVNRIRLHSGEPTEQRYKVKSYGIPIELFPLTGTNAIKLNYHNQWIRTRRLVEHNQNRYMFECNCAYKPEYECGFEIKGSGGEPITIVECPCSNDVVFRNGTQSTENPGNAMFRHKILSYWERREKIRTNSRSSNNNRDHPDAGTNSPDDASETPPSLSPDVNHDREFRDQLIVDIEVHQKGRFLEWDKNLTAWIQMKDRARIHRKVAMAFYNCTKRRYNKSNNSKTTLSTEKKRRERSSSDSSSIGGGGSHHINRFTSHHSIHAEETTSRSHSAAAAYQFIDRESANFPSNVAGGDDCCIPNTAVSAFETDVNGDDDGNATNNKRSCLAWRSNSSSPTTAGSNSSMEIPDPEMGAA
jgi:hypothetical protein